MKKLWVYGIMLAAVCLFASGPSYAMSVGFTVSDLGGGVYEYKWTVDYPGSSNPDGYFGQLEVYLNDYMGTATNNTTTLNGATLKVTKPLTADGIVVTYPWNAAHYNNTAHPDWTQARIDLENPDQEGFDPDVGEIAFLTNAADSAPGIYNFSYQLNRNLTSFFYEIHNANEADNKLVQSGTAVVPLPPSVLLLGSGLLGLGAIGWRRRRL
jgi:hypothetical protein